jgi:hypothetical protein
MKTQYVGNCELINIRTEINDIENTETVGKINEHKDCFIEKMNEIDKKKNPSYIK